MLLNHLVGLVQAMRRGSHQGCFSRDQLKPHFQDPSLSPRSFIVNDATDVDVEIVQLGRSLVRRCSKRVPDCSRGPRSTPRLIRDALPRGGAEPDDNVDVVFSATGVERNRELPLAEQYLVLAGFERSCRLQSLGRSSGWTDKGDVLPRHGELPLRTAPCSASLSHHEGATYASECYRHNAGPSRLWLDFAEARLSPCSVAVRSRESRD